MQNTARQILPSIMSLGVGSCVWEHGWRPSLHNCRIEKAQNKTLQFGNFLDALASLVLTPSQGFIGIIQLDTAGNLSN